MLSRDEIQRILAVVGLCGEVGSEREFAEVLTGPVRSLLPHGCVAYGLCRPSTDVVVRVRNVDFPATFVAHVAQEGEVLASPVAQRWKRDRTVTHFCPATIEQALRTHGDAFDRWYSLFRTTGLDTVTAHGVTDDEQDISSYFAFGNTQHTLQERDAVLVRILTQHLHAAATALLRRGGARAGAARDRNAPLSVREREVLAWVQAGKTNYEIGLILGISEFTVKNHMKRICSKLDAGNRAHAIAKAVHAGFLLPAPCGDTSAGFA